MKIIKHIIVSLLLIIFIPVLGGVDNVYGFLEILPIIIAIIYFINYLIINDFKHGNVIKKLSSNYFIVGLVFGYFAFTLATSLNLSTYDPFISVIKNTFLVSVREAASVVWFLNSLIFSLIGLLIDVCRNFLKNDNSINK